MDTQFRKARAGFTLAELMVVIVIIGLLATLVVPNVVSKLARANGPSGAADLDTPRFVRPPLMPGQQYSADKLRKI